MNKGKRVLSFFIINNTQELEIYIILQSAGYHAFKLYFGENLVTLIQKSKAIFEILLYDAKTNNQ